MRISFTLPAAALLVLAAACSSTAPAAKKSGTPTSPTSSHAIAAASTAKASSATGSASAGTAGASTLTSTYRPAHVVVVVMENHSYSDIIGSSSAPYLNYLAAHGKSLTHMYGVTHPSEPNYLALFSGTTHGVTDDHCPANFISNNLGNELRTANRSFTGYSESLPYAGDRVCVASPYARKHAPWVDALDLPASVNQPFTAFPTDYTRLPTVSFVIPNLNHDMHDGSVAAGDTWVHQHLAAYASWALTHNSLLIVTWDEDDRSESNRIPTIFYGQGIVRGQVSTTVNHYGLLRTIEDLYGLPRLYNAATAHPVLLP